MTSSRRLSTPALIGLAIAVALAISAYGFIEYGGWNAEGALAAARYTARFAFPWFVVAISASALAALWPGGWRSVLLRRRRAIGLSFAAAHGVHLIMLTIAINVFGDPTSIVTLIGGGTVYVLILAMALTSNDAAVRAMGPRGWKALHLTGAIAIGLVFANSYAGRLGEKPWLAIPALTLLIGALTLRIAAWIKKRARRTAQTA